MVLDVEVQQQRTGEFASARFVAKGRIDRAAFGMTKFTDMTGNNVDLTIRAEAVR
jgi:polyisoprenoid-binding protein YceI